MVISLSRPLNRLKLGNTVQIDKLFFISVIIEVIDRSNRAERYTKKISPSQNPQGRRVALHE